MTVFVLQQQKMEQNDFKGIKQSLSHQEQLVGKQCQRTSAVCVVITCCKRIEHLLLYELETHSDVQLATDVSNARRYTSELLEAELRTSQPRKWCRR